MMGKSLTIIALLLSIFGLNCHQAPAPGSGGGESTTRNYELGSLYTYDYTLGIELTEPGPLDIKPSSVGYKFLSKVSIRPLWQYEPNTILEIQISQPQLQIQSRKAPQPEGYRDHSSNLDGVPLHPLFVHFKDGVIQKVYRVPDDNPSLVNIKKGIANLFQINTDGAERENSPMGLCKVSYKKDNFQVEKTIVNPRECVIGDEISRAHYVNSSSGSPVLGAGVESVINAHISMSRDSAIIELAKVIETHQIRVNVKRDIGAFIGSNQMLKLYETTSSEEQIVQGSSASGAINEISRLRGLSLLPESIIPSPEETQTCTTDPKLCKPFEQLTKTMAPQNMASSPMASAFLQAVAKFRGSKEAEIEQILKKETYILPQLLDAVAASGSIGAHRSAMKVLKFDHGEEIDNPERYLFALSLAPSINEDILQELFKLAQKGVKNVKLQQTLVLTIASLAHNLRKIQGSSSEIKVSSDIEEYLGKSLNNCKDPTCQQLYLRAFKNLQSEGSLALLTKLVQNSDAKTSVVAMKALHSMPPEYFKTVPKIRQLLLRIILQLVKKYDSSVRTLAIDILLRDHPSKEEIREMLQLLKSSDKGHGEVGTYLWHRLNEFAESDPNISPAVWSIINEENMRTYNHLAPRGLSTAFSRTFAQTPSGNSSFSNAIEMTGKVLKRNSFDVFIRSQNDSLHLLSLGIFAGGLSSFASSNGDEEAEEESEDDPATAGMELTVLGVQLRPIVFFTGKGELMGLVWSGSGSERTTALQGNVLLQDERKKFPMFNGLVADVNIQGGLSFDLAGQMQVSLWHRTANSLVENKAGILLQSIISVDTSFVRSKIEYNLGAEAALHFTSDINFYDGVKMCLKLTQPEFNIKQNIFKTERIPGSKHRLRKAKYKSFLNSGLSYALNRKNSELCSAIHREEL